LVYAIYYEFDSQDLRFNACRFGIWHVRFDITIFLLMHCWR